MVKWILKGIVVAFLPWTRKGRRLRIEKLIHDTGEERDICAAIVYTRDALADAVFSDEEYDDFVRVEGRLERGEITLPADRSR